MKLSTEQLAFWDSFGYLVFPQLFDPAEVDWITAEFEGVVESDAATAGKDRPSHDGSSRTMIVPTIDHSPRLSTLLDDRRIVGICSDLLGKDFCYASGDGNYYSGDTGWHPDGGYEDERCFALKIAFYLDPLDQYSGCVRLLPGSHKNSSPWRADQAMQLMTEMNIAPTDLPGQLPVPTQPGDIVVFNHKTYHASFGGGQRRRMFTMNMVRGGQSADDIALLDGYLKAHCPAAHGYLIGGMYASPMLETATAERRVHLRQLHERHAIVWPEHTSDANRQAKL